MSDDDFFDTGFEVIYWRTKLTVLQQIILKNFDKLFVLEQLSEAQDKYNFYKNKYDKLKGKNNG